MNRHVERFTSSIVSIVDCHDRVISHEHKGRFDPMRCSLMPRVSHLLALAILLLAAPGPLRAAAAQLAKTAAAYQGWRHAGAIFILTTPEGANLPASTSEDG